MLGLECDSRPPRLMALVQLLGEAQIVLFGTGSSAYLPLTGSGWSFSPDSNMVSAFHLRDPSKIIHFHQRLNRAKYLICVPNTALLSRIR